MKKNYSGNIVLAAFLLGGFIACKNKSEQHDHAAHSKEMVIDSSIASVAKPVNAQVIASMPVIAPESGTRIFTTDIKGQITYDTRNQVSISSSVAGRIEKLYIKYNYQPVRRGQLIMEIYSPDLAAAQREMLFIARSGNDENLLAKAKQRLFLLGMTEGQINTVLKTGNILYRVPVYSHATGYILEKSVALAAGSPVISPASSASGDGMDGMSAASGSAVMPAPSPSNTPLMIREGQYVSAGQALFSIYKSGNVVAAFALKPALTAHIQKGRKLIFHTNADANKVYTGEIGLIQPVVRSGEKFTMVRVYLSSIELLPGQLVTANIPIVLKGGWWLPKKAVWQSGNKSIVFKKEGSVFVPKQVETTVEAEGMVLVTSAIGNWLVAGNAAFLVDSESFIKTTDQKD